MIRFLLVAGLATALLPGVAEAKRGGGARASTSTSVDAAPSAKSRAVVVPGSRRTAAGEKPETAARVPFPTANHPVVTPAAATTAAAPARAACGSSLVGGFCVLN